MLQSETEGASDLFDDARKSSDMLSTIRIPLCCVPAPPLEAYAVQR